MSNRFKPKRNKALRRFPNGLAAKKVELPGYEKVVLKEVPAVFTDSQGVKHEIGTAYIYNDGTVDHVLNKDVPDWIIAEIRKVEKQYEAWQDKNAKSLGKLFEENKEN